MTVLGLSVQCAINRRPADGEQNRTAVKVLANSSSTLCAMRSDLDNDFLPTPLLLLLVKTVFVPLNSTLVFLSIFDVESA